MKTIIHKADERGHANHGWLDSHHSFSFAGYYDPAKTNFGVLRVLNDDIVDGGMGFGTHPHQDMEIISIPLKGALAHKDSMGNTHVIKKNDVQVMSAGTGVYHSEFNPNEDEKVNFLQIWVIPNKKKVEPRYGQVTFEREKDVLQKVVSPNPEDSDAWIHQDAWFYLGSLSSSFETEYKMNKEGNGLYVFVLEGEVEIAGELLNKRDGLGVYETDSLMIKSNSETELLLMEVPMIF